MSGRPLTHEQTIDILTGPREIPPSITNNVEQMLNDGTPIVDIDRFSECLISLMAETPSDPEQAIAATYESIVLLGSCSLEMAWQQAGDIRIPRPRRLHEHNQSVLNTRDRVFGESLTDPRDRVLRPMFSFQDGGKSHTVALALLADPTNPRPNRNQAVDNRRMIDNVLGPVPADILTSDEKTVIKLLIQQTSIGDALRLHSQKGKALDEVVAMATQELDGLRAQCPDDYRDRFDDYLLISYLTDAGAHTQRARYTDAKSGTVMADVTHEDRFNPDGSEVGLTLDRLFSEAPDDMNTLKLFQPKHLAVMRLLFPNHYE